MIKRTKGYVLLTLLVITGLASQVPKNTLSGKERKVLITQLKETKAAFLYITDDLSEAQINFKPAGKLSIKELMQQHVVAETNLWTMADTAIDQSNNYVRELKTKAESNITILNIDVQRLLNPQAYESGEKRSASEAMELFTTTRKDVIKYVKTTTIDAHQHYTQTPFGRISLYQVLSSIPANTVYYTQQIAEIKTRSDFPK